jgi:hypothetical protein
MQIGAAVGALVLGATLAMASAAPAGATMRIVGDAGGQIGPYLENLLKLRNSGQQVVIDGPCLSACTLVLGVVPRERICVTRRARLGFHAAWHPGQNGEAVQSRGGTQLLMEIYPQNVRRWLAKRGGLTQTMKYLTGRELASMYTTCN